METGKTEDELTEDDLDDEQVNALFEEDWERDAKGADCLQREGFFNAVFELADAWCNSLDLQDHLDYLSDLFDRMVSQRMELPKPQPQQKQKQVNKN